MKVRPHYEYDVPETAAEPKAAEAQNVFGDLGGAGPASDAKASEVDGNWAASLRGLANCAGPQPVDQPTEA